MFFYLKKNRVYYLEYGYSQVGYRYIIDLFVFVIHLNNIIVVDDINVYICINTVHVLDRIDERFTYRV